ncbi:mediator complex, subunit Med21 [Microdochium trichocladiopsis]|uniref:Mediator of RNA polymerase II transcription subunit 21 n=1 Tax=Microdochium trichocladiopsis TaxID=1682393 RepID=A0A9P9BQW2_9PEZI|nr:mediator complex, subunit Med21 [Microdochium trichocladiopsis]KAH7031322.1 mediator complex, subunit Med21 [Microdochium trichocladiopsis]
MGDRLTQLQDAVDQFATQMVASIHYLNRHHDLELLGPKDQINQATKQNAEEDQKEIDPHPSDSFNASQLELARDLITKEQQIEYLISILPGLLNSEQDQDRTIKELEEELKVAEAQRQDAVREKEVTMKKLDEVIRSIRRP